VWLIAATVAPLAAQERPQSSPPPPVAEALRNAGGTLKGLDVPAADAFSRGDREIAAKSAAKGPVAVAGTLRVAGTIDGDAFAYGGDIIVLNGGHITGSAVALNGTVQVQEGGAVDGDRRGVGGSLSAIPVRGPAHTARETVGLTLGWAGLLLIVGIGLLVAAKRTLDVVGETIDLQFGKSFLVGVAATIGLVPALLLLVVALTLTILGVLLVPFAIVAYILAVIGLVALGLIATIRVTGHAIGGGGRDLTARGAALRALVVGVAFYLGLWLVAGLATPWPVFASVMRVIAFGVTWAAATLGLGATIISRAGNRPLRAPAPAAIPTAELAYEHTAVGGAAMTPEWLTPTPVSGVVAAKRRPSAQAKEVS